MPLLKISEFFNSGYVVGDAISQLKQVGLALKPIMQIDQHGVPAGAAVRIGAVGLVVQLALEDDEHSFLGSKLCDEGLGGFGVFGVVWPLFVTWRSGHCHRPALAMVVRQATTGVAIVAVIGGDFKCLCV